MTTRPVPAPAAAGPSTTVASARRSSGPSRPAPTGSWTARGSARRRKKAAATVPVYVHVMAGSSGEGDVSDGQIADQIDVLNATYGGAESGEAANTGFSFSLAGTDRFYNDTWHRDGASTTYRSQTRQGGANALNIWLVDFSYLGIATFPWDYGSDPSVDGIRVQYSSLPGGDATNFNLGETATHEAGHWLGLYHTFQGGCTSTNDEVSRHPRPGRVRAAAARSAPTPARCRVWTRSTTTWTTATTPATTSSRPVRARGCPRCGRPTAAER